MSTELNAVEQRSQVAQLLEGGLLGNARPRDNVVPNGITPLARRALRVGQPTHRPRWHARRERRAAGNQLARKGHLPRRLRGPLLRVILAMLAHPVPPSPALSSSFRPPLRGVHPLRQSSWAKYRIFVLGEQASPARSRHPNLPP